MTSQERWGRLAQDLRDAGYDNVKITEQRYWAGTKNRPVAKTSFSIFLRGPEGLVVVGDQYWNKNDDVWVGYDAYLEDGESIVKDQLYATKDRAVLVRFVERVLSK